MDGLLPKKGSAIRNHLRRWQEQQGSSPKVPNLQKLPGFDISGNIQNSVSQLGEIDPGASTNGDEADFLEESEAEMDAEGEVVNVAPDPDLLRGGEMVLVVCVQPRYRKISC